MNSIYDFDHVYKLTEIEKSSILVVMYQEFGIEIRLLSTDANNQNAEFIAGNKNYYVNLEDFWNLGSPLFNVRFFVVRLFENAFYGGKLDKLCHEIAAKHIQSKSNSK